MEFLIVGWLAFAIVVAVIAGGKVDSAILLGADVTMNFGGLTIEQLAEKYSEPGIVKLIRKNLPN